MVGVPLRQSKSGPKFSGGYLPKVLYDVFIPQEAGDGLASLGPSHKEFFGSVKGSEKV